MTKKLCWTLAMAALLPVSAAVIAQTPAPPTASAAPAPGPRPAMPSSPPGSMTPRAVQAGRYTTDPAHTLVGWRINHFGFNDYLGQFGDASGTLTLDPARPSRMQVTIDIPIASLSVVSSGLRQHLLGPDFFDAAAHPTARFVSTAVRSNGTRATIEGNLTLRGQTRPLVLQARFAGTGTNPFNRKPTVGFHATTSLRRSQWGLGYGVPLVADRVDLEISAAFERQGDVPTR